MNGSTDTDIHADRRTVLRTVAAGATAGALATVASPASAQSTDLAAWFADTDNADSVTDQTGQDAVTVDVGTDGNGPGFGFGPAAVRIDPGTTVTWEWTGKGGEHNVVAEDDSFESDLQGEAGATYGVEVEDNGVLTYLCTPHEAAGMKGAIVVGSPTQGSRIDWLKTGLVGLAGAIVAGPFVCPAQLISPRIAE